MKNPIVGIISWVYAVFVGLIAISELQRTLVLGIFSIGVLVGILLLLVSAVLALPPIGRWLAARWGVRSGTKFSAVGVSLLLALIILPAAERASSRAAVDQLREQIKATISK